MSRYTTPPIHDILKNYFGYDQFRPLQEEIITHILSGRDAVVLMPTGGGKSLCYQLPALAMDGVTIVISPLIALMKDQVDNLKLDGVAAEYINSTLPFPEILRIQDAARNQQLKILYVAPERLALPGFQAFLQDLKVSLIAIDEAHCISEWGHDFRPDYRNLANLRQEFPQVPVVALTATATPFVRDDIIAQLKLTDPKIFQSSFNRENLFYHIWPKKNAFQSLVNFLSQYKNQPTIIYCFSRKDTELVASKLCAQGFPAVAYHAGLEDQIRSEVQDKFIRDEVSIIVDTIAFGMGIDKPDIRLIVHYDLPKSVEGYYQETGRAGRDGLPSGCLLFYSWGDKIKQDFFIDQIVDEQEKAKAQGKLARIVEFCQSQKCRRKFLLEYFGEQWDKPNCGRCDICITPLEEFDATEIVQNILKTIALTGGRFGAGHLVDVLRGAETEKIFERRHDRLAVYGVAKDFSTRELRRIIDLLLDRNLIVKTPGEYPTLIMSKSGQQLMTTNEKINLPKPPPMSVAKDAGKSTGKMVQDLKYDQVLFEKLRALRKKIADEKNVPPFMVFPDRSLFEMAFYFPQDTRGMGRIFGVGDKKLREFGQIFVEEIADYLKTARPPRPAPSQPLAASGRKQEPSQKNVSTYDETQKLIDQKLTLSEIARQRNLAVGTILSHLEKIVQDGYGINRLEFLRPAEPKFSKIRSAFEIYGTGKLSPVKEFLGVEFSYDDIRLARIFLVEQHGEEI